MITPYPPSDCVPCGISPDDYYPSVTYGSADISSVTNGQFSYSRETFPGNTYQSDYRSDSLSMRHYYQTSLISKSYVPHQNLVQNHSYRTTKPYVNTSVISYSSATQMGPRLLTGCRGSWSGKFIVTTIQDICPELLRCTVMIPSFWTDKSGQSLDHNVCHLTHYSMIEPKWNIVQILGLQQFFGCPNI